MATTLANLDQTLGAPSDGTTYCYGLGRSSISGNTGSSGGASTLLRTCQNVSQTEPTGVLLIAAGGGGTGDDASDIGGEGGFAGSTTAGACPPDCLKVPRGNPSQGLRSDGGADGGIGGKGGSGGPAGQDGVGGEGGGVPGVGMAGWVQGEPQVSGSAGAGGTVGGNYQGGRGGGGGGYGGGGGDNGGGAGGGSYAAQSTCTLPADYFTTGHSGDGSLVFGFNSPNATDCKAVVNGPVVDSVSKSSVPVGDPFDIDGSGFVDVTAVKLGDDTLATDAWSVESDTEISVPQAPEPAQLNQPLAVVVETSAGISNDNVTVTITASTSPPHVGKVAPSPATVGQTITITGTGFTGATAVQIAGSPVQGWMVNSDTTITLPAPDVGQSLYGKALAVEVDTAAGASNSDVSVTIYPA